MKQYLKDTRALRIETVINDAYDLGCQRRLRNLNELRPGPPAPAPPGSTTARRQSRR